MNPHTPTRLDKEIAAHQQILEGLGEPTPGEDPFDAALRDETARHLEGLKTSKRRRVYYGLEPA